MNSKSSVESALKGAHSVFAVSSKKSMTSADNICEFS